MEWCVCMCVCVCVLLTGYFFFDGTMQESALERENRQVKRQASSSEDDSSEVHVWLIWDLPS